MKTYLMVVLFCLILVIGATHDRVQKQKEAKGIKTIGGPFGTFGPSNSKAHRPVTSSENPTFTKV